MNTIPPIFLTDSTINTHSLILALDVSIVAYNEVVIKDKESGNCSPRQMNLNCVTNDLRKALQKAILDVAKTVEEAVAIEEKINKELITKSASSWEK